MEKPKINVIDLDKTLIKYDTLRELLIREISKGNLYLTGISILRIVRLLSSLRYKMKVQKILAEKYTSSFFKEYADEIFRKVNPEVMQLIQDNTDENTINILLSASPNDYVNFLCKKLNWEGSGSYFDEKGRFHHLFGEEKANWIKKRFPQKEFNYHFAISDSKTDLALLNFFEKKIFFRND